MSRFLNVEAGKIWRYLIATGLSLSSIAAFTSPALAETTATITLSGYVPTVLEVTNDVNIAVPLDGASVSNYTVGSVTVKSNSLTGYRVTLRSVNDGFLKRGPDAVPYTLSYEGETPLAPSASPTTLESKTILNSDWLACATKGGCERSLAVHVEGSKVKGTVGTYTDTLKFDIMAND